MFICRLSRLLTLDTHLRLKNCHHSPLTSYAAVWGACLSVFLCLSLPLCPFFYLLLLFFWALGKPLQQQPLAKSQHGKASFHKERCALNEHSKVLTHHHPSTGNFPKIFLFLVYLLVIVLLLFFLTSTCKHFCPLSRLFPRTLTFIIYLFS